MLMINDICGRKARSSEQTSAACDLVDFQEHLSNGAASGWQIVGNLSINRNELDCISSKPDFSCYNILNFKPQIAMV